MKETIKLDGYVAISLDDYANYERLKAEKEKPKIDYDRLKTGSVVRLDLNKSCDLTAATSSAYVKGITYQLLIPPSEYQYTKEEGLRHVSNKKYTNLIGEDGSIIHIMGNLEGKVKEVISY